MVLIELSFCGEVYVGGGNFCNILFLSNKCGVLYVKMMKGVSQIILTSSDLGERGALLSFASYLL